MRRRRRKPPVLKIASRVQNTSRFARDGQSPDNGYVKAIGKRAGIEVYDSVEAANRAGLPMPGQF